MGYFDRIRAAVDYEATGLVEAMEAFEGPDGVVVKQSPRAVAPKLALADYVEREAQPPASVHRSHVQDHRLRDPLGNDEWGDCGDAMVIHAIEAFHLDAETPVPPFSADDALKLYSEVSGFDPSQTRPDGSNPTDTGTDNQQLIDFWRDTGVLCHGSATRHKIAGSVWVDPHDPVLSRIAIWEFVALFRAVGLPLTAQNQRRWQVTNPNLNGDAELGSWGYHDIPYFSYDDRYLRCDTWGVPKLVEWSFDHAYAAEGFVVVTEEQLGVTGVSPSGVNWTKLSEDLAKFPPVQR